MTTTEINKDTTWFRVYKYTGKYAYAQSGGLYQLLYRNVKRGFNGQPGYAGGFDTKAEAIEAGKARGWVQVDTWKEAKIQAQPFLEAKYAAIQATQQARTGKASVTVYYSTDDGSWEKITRYLSSEAVKQLLAILGKPDQHGVLDF